LAIALQAPLLHAEMLGPETAVAEPAQSGAEQDRAKVREILDRASVRERLQILGVDALDAQSRVDAMSDAEVHALAQRIDSMPAGGALSQNDLILVLLIAILVALLI
jgi:hypothetical protein